MRGVLLYACVVVLVLSVNPVAAQDRDVMELPPDLDPASVTVPPPGAGAKVAGTFLGTATSDDLPGPVHFIVAFGKDGDFISSDSTDFASGGLGTLQSNQHGTWIKTGSHQIKIRSLFFNYDTDGELVTIGRNTSVLDFNSDFSEGVGTILVEVFAASQLLDPLDPNADAAPIGTLVLDAVARRLVNDDEDDDS